MYQLWSTVVGMVVCLCILILIVVIVYTRERYNFTDQEDKELKRIVRHCEKKEKI